MTFAKTATNGIKFRGTNTILEVRKNFLTNEESTIRPRRLGETFCTLVRATNLFPAQSKRTRVGELTIG